MIFRCSLLFPLIYSLAWVIHIEVEQLAYSLSKLFIGGAQLSRQLDHLLLLLSDSCSHCWQLTRQVLRNIDNAVSITVDQIAGLNLQPSNLDWASEFDNVDIGTGDRQPAGKDLEVTRLDTVQLAGGSVRYRAYASQGLQDVHVDYSQESADAWLLICILHDDYARRRYAGDVLPPISSFDVPASHGRRMRRSYLAGGRIADQGRKILEQATEARRGKPLVAQPDAEGLYGVGYDTRVECPKLVDLLGR